MSSTLFLSNISVVDHAYIDQRGNVVGGSFNPSFFVTGEVDPVEQVVVDFSTVKNQIKNAIDDRQNGFDHKLWFIHGWSNGIINRTSEHYHISTPTTELVLPVNAVKVISGGPYDVTIGAHIGAYVEHALRKLHPKNNVTVVCENSTKCHFPGHNSTHETFTYSHGLKDSTSWGCQNIAHGHLSYIQLYPPRPRAAELMETIAADLDDTVFIFRDNITSDTDSAITVSYTTPTRGLFSATYRKSAYKIVVLETETTVEHLVEYVAAKYADELIDADVHRILVSEGLSKGAMIDQ